MDQADSRVGVDDCRSSIQRFLYNVYGFWIGNKIIDGGEENCMTKVSI